MQLHTTCTIPADTADERVIVYLYLYHVNGSVYGDVAQLEPGTVPSRCNLVDNGDFHLGNIKGFSNTGTAACDEITTIGAGANLPAQHALMVTKASAIMYEKPDVTAAQAATVYNGLHLASSFLFTQIVDTTKKINWYRVKTSGGTWGYIQSADVLSYLPNGNSSNGGVVLKEIAVLRSAASHTSIPVEEYIPKGTGVVVRSKAADADGNNWYRVALQIDNKRYIGYLPANQVVRFARNNASGEMAAADNYYVSSSLTAATAGNAAKGSKYL